MVPAPHLLPFPSPVDCPSPAACSFTCCLPPRRPRLSLCAPVDCPLTCYLRTYVGFGYLSPAAFPLSYWLPLTLLAVLFFVVFELTRYPRAFHLLSTPHLLPGLSSAAFGRACYQPTLPLLLSLSTPLLSLTCCLYLHPHLLTAKPR